MQKKVKLSIIKANNIVAIYGTICSEEPLTMKFEQMDIFNNYDIIIFPEINKDKREIYIISVIEIDDTIVTFQKVRCISDIFFQNNYIEFSNTISIAKVNMDNEPRYKNIANNINKKELESTASRLQEVFTRDEENREIITFLMEINSKLDEILYLLKPKVNIEGSEDYLSLILSEDGLCFASTKNIASDKIFVYLEIRDCNNFLSLAVLCSIKELSKSGEYIVYRALFEDLHIDIKDKIMKYIFKLEREMLKRGLQNG